MTHDLELTQSQLGFVAGLLTIETHANIVLLPCDSDTPQRVAAFTSLNNDVNVLLECGFVEDITNGLPRPPGFPNEFRIVRLTELGRNLLENSKGTSDRAS
jgi:hypothetical protein